VSLRRHITLIRQNTPPTHPRSYHVRAQKLFFFVEIKGYSEGGLFSEPAFLPFFTNVPSSPHTSSHMFGHHPATGMDAAPGCRLQRRSSANILTAWPGRVAQAPRAGRARAPWSCWLTMLAPIVENCTVRGSARARRPVDYEANSIANRGRLRHGPAQLAMA